MFTITNRAFPAFVLGRTTRNGHFKLMAALLAFIFPLVTLKDVGARTQWCPSGSFCDISAITRRAVYFPVYGTADRRVNVKDQPAI